jgi:hypothetical protein
MQLARNIFPRELPGTERTLKRKLQEARVAQQIEDRFSKTEILEMYLNHIYFGGGAYGIEAAARLYFGKACGQLTLPEAATLAALPKAPTHYDPRRRPEQARVRRDLVLTLMERQQLIAEDAATEARETELAARTNGRRDRSGVPLGAYFIDIVRDALEEQFGEALYRSRSRSTPRWTPLHSGRRRRSWRPSSRRWTAACARVMAPLQGAVVRAGGGDRRRAGTSRRPRPDDVQIQSRSAWTPPGRQRVQALRLRGRPCGGHPHQPARARCTAAHAAVAQ